MLQLKSKLIGLGGGITIVSKVNDGETATNLQSLF